MSNINPANLPPLDLTALDAELRAEQKYGDSPTEAFIGEAANAATLGLSDAALVAAGADPERLRETRARSPVAAGLGTAAGVVAPALATLGTSVPAQALGAGARAVIGAGTIAEGLAAKGLAKAGIEGAKATIASTAARGATEGALVGAGQLISDVALENADLSAESALASVGHGALFGAGFGTLLGTAQASAPLATKGAKAAKNAYRGVLGQAIDPLTDPVEASLRAVSSTAAARQKLRETLGNRIDDLPAYLKNDLELGYTTTAGDLVAKNNQVTKALGQQIDNVVNGLDEQVALVGTSANRAEAYGRLIARLDEVAAGIGPGKSAARPALKVIDRYRKDLINLAAKPEAFSFGELNALRKQYQGTKFKGGGALESFEANVANSLRGEARDILDDVAAATNESLGLQLKDLNRRYGIGQQISKPLKFASERAPDFSSPIAFAMSTAGNAARNAAVITDIATKTQSIKKTISDGIDKVLTRAPGRSKLDLPATRIMVESGFALGADGSKPKNKQVALENVQNNLNRLNNTDDAVDLIAKRTARIANASPETAVAMQEKLAAGALFLNSKLPKPAVNQGAFVRKYVPSTLEVAKFERYLQAVEKPLSIMQEIAQGTLTREHVEALQAVYPEIYKEIRVQMLDKIADGTLDVPYDRKIQIGILLDVPADSSLRPENLMQLQASIASVQPEPGIPAEQQAPRAAGLDQLNIAEREATGVQRVSVRE